MTTAPGSAGPAPKWTGMIPSWKRRTTGWPTSTKTPSKKRRRMELSKKLMAEIKAALEKEHVRPFSDEEVEKVADFMKNLAEMQIDIFLEDQKRQQQLKASPGGFHLGKDGYSCRICHGSASGKNSWFDQYGLKCMT